MKFTTLLLTTILPSLALCQSPSNSTSTSSSVTTTASLSPEQSCIANKCDTSSSDYANCAADCVGNPHPSASQVNATNECVTDCLPSGTNVTDAQASEYASCKASCISASYFPTTGAATATGGAATTTGSGSAGSTGSSGSGSGSSKSGSSGSSSSTSTGTASSSSSTGNVAANAMTPVFASAGGLVAFFAAFLAL